jgi:hypothetical protein
VRAERLARLESPPREDDELVGDVHAGRGRERGRDRLDAVEDGWKRRGSVSVGRRGEVRASRSDLDDDR